jgi:transcriptional regulator with XRE-family HTH domain
MDQAALAERAGISVETIKRIENLDGPLTNVKAGTLDAIKRTLEETGVEFGDRDRPGVVWLKIYADAAEAAVLIRGNGLPSVPCPTLQEAIIAFHHLAPAAKLSATIRIESGRIFTAEEVERGIYKQTRQMQGPPTLDHVDLLTRKVDSQKIRKDIELRFSQPGVEQLDFTFVRRSAAIELVASLKGKQPQRIGVLTIEGEKIKGSPEIALLLNRRPTPAELVRWAVECWERSPFNKAKTREQRVYSSRARP